MSLVEQAIARMRSANAAKTGPANAEPARPLPAARAAPVLNTPVSETPARSIVIDTAALRAGQHLPEASKERQFADHYRQIKRPLISKALTTGTAGAGREPLFIIVASALPGDGKTFTSINLALSIARERDVSVLLVDGDIPKRDVSRIFGLSRAPGLTDALSDGRSSVESLVVGTDVRGLSILPSGEFVDGAAELMSSKRMGEIIAELARRNPRRIILVDAPPLLVTSEGRALVRIAGQVVLVVRAGWTPRKAVEEAAAMCDVNQAGGIVLNEIEAGITESYYGYGGYGSYGVALDSQKDA